MTKLIFVRHCEAEGNTRGILQGRTDDDISGHAKTQLELVSLRLRNVPISAIYSSPLVRARKTAEAINRYHNLPIHFNPGLTEIDVGEWENKSWDEIARETPGLLREWNETPERFHAKGGESMQQVQDRMWAAVTGIVRENPDSTVCITSHGCAIRTFLCRALGLPLKELSRVGWCDNTGISVVEFDENLKPNVVLMNDASHIPPELSAYRSKDPDALKKSGIAP